MSKSFPRPSEEITRAIIISAGGWAIVFVVVALLLSGCAGYVEQQGCNGLIGQMYKCK